MVMRELRAAVTGGMLAGAVLTAGTALGVDGNLLLNADMVADDGLGCPQAWSFRVITKRTNDRYSILPNGDGSFTLKFPDTLYLVQKPLTLISGETYRISAEVRTTKIGGKGKGMRMGMWDARWNKEWWSEPFPADTQGEWQPVQWQGEVHTRWTNGFNFAVAGSMGDDPAARLDMRNLALTPVSAKAKALSRPVPRDMLRALPVRIVPIDPKIGQLPAEGCEMTFFWPGRRREGLAGCRLVAAVDGKDLAPAAFGARHRAKVKVGALTRGTHRLKVRVEGPDGALLAVNEYPLRAIAKVAGATEGRKLNNFVSELLNCPLKDGETRFVLSKDSWVWISFEGAAATAQGCIDYCCIPSVRKREGERFIETMRRMPAGTHVLHVTGAGTGGRLRVHRIKELVTTAYSMDRQPCSQNQFRFGYSLDFVKRFMVNSFNTVYPFNWSDTSSVRAGWYAERGYKVTSTMDLPVLDPIRMDAEASYQVLAGTAGWKKGFDLEVDENGMLAPRLSHVNFAEAAWRMVGERPGQAINADWCDAPSSVFCQPDIETAEIAAIVNSGYGRGMIQPEVYSPALDDPQRAYDWEMHFANFARSAIDFVPAAKDSIQYHFASFIDLGTWSDYPCPEADIKVHYAHFVRSIATKPEFDGTIAGLAFGGVTHGDEETVRWMAKVFRHYAVEGRTNDIVAAYGFRYLPGFVKDPDFVEGLTKWTAKPAEAGGVTARKIAGYGKDVQARQKVPTGTGDGVAVFTRSAKGPNELSQTVTGLTPGKY